MNEKNLMPEEMVEVDPMNAVDMREFFLWGVNEKEYRQAYERESCEVEVRKHGFVSLNILWIDKEQNLGYAIGKENLTDDIHYWKIGSPEKWQKRLNAHIKEMGNLD